MPIARCTDRLSARLAATERREGSLPGAGGADGLQRTRRNASADGELAMSHRHGALIRTIFHDPISGNIHWREVESLLHHLGAQVEPLSGNRIRFRIGHVEAVLHRPHQGNVLDRNAVRSLRGHLAIAGVTPSQYEQAAKEPDH
jgi:hypothetical protein